MFLAFRNLFVDSFIYDTIENNIEGNCLWSRKVAVAYKAISFSSTGNNYVESKLNQSFLTFDVFVYFMICFDALEI